MGSGVRVQVARVLGGLEFPASQYFSNLLGATDDQTDMRNAHPLLPSLLITVVLCACGERSPDSPPNRNSTRAATAPASETDKWLGKWIGPEGTFIAVTGGAFQYQVIIRNLDGPRTFQGFGNGSKITFERDGVNESIRAGTGVETGMKWLADKANCLVVKAGEGYCRN